MYSAVEITTRDGRTYESGIVERGADRFDRPALEKKFRWLVGHVLDTEVVEDMLVQLGRAAELDHVGQLLEPLSGLVLGSMVRNG